MNDDSKKEVFIANNEFILKKIVKRLANPKWEERLRKTVRIPPEQEKEQDINPSIAQESISLKKMKRKRGPSKIDSLTPYNVADDILHLPTSITVGQLLQYPNQRRNLAKILKRSAISKETNFLYPEEQC
ncbi:hypothetical protein C2G38_2237371 [Gigaspora rosea]|uniref:Uncharacterized protein n=1 Tax=Gigaspora rosea TaxID=44941 RepID=A0A397TT28_9GLOM|nr:hypothetical protein C2G38_2237371 [Gigaspora rosea]